MRTPFWISIRAAISAASRSSTPVSVQTFRAFPMNKSQPNVRCFSSIALDNSGGLLADGCILEKTLGARLPMPTVEYKWPETLLAAVIGGVVAWCTTIPLNGLINAVSPVHIPLWSTTIAALMLVTYWFTGAAEDRIDN